MRSASLSGFAERPIRLEAYSYGTPCLSIMEDPEFASLSPVRLASIHDAAPNTAEGMDRLRRAVEAFNMIMSSRSAVIVMGEFNAAGANLAAAE